MKLSSHRTSKNKRLVLEMTSMIDVVFLLLIFFMTTASLVQTERNLDPAIKVDRSAASKSTRDLEPAIIEVVPSGDDAIFKLGSREIDSAEELTRILRMFENKLDGAFVRVADGVPFGKAAAAIQACKSAGFGLVSYVPM